MDNNTPNIEPSNVNQAVAMPSPLHNRGRLIGPKIFVYIISLLVSLVVGEFIASYLLNSYLSEKSNAFENIGLFSGLLGGVVAAWCWARIMSFHVLHRASSLGLLILGIVWGIIAGWIGSIILWICMIGFVLVVNEEVSEIVGISIMASVGVAIFGSIGGATAGLICGVVWAIWTRPGK